MTTMTTSTTPAPGRYTVDPARTTISLKAKHMFGTGTVNATLALNSAEIVVAEPLTATTLHAVIDAASFDSANAKRDEKVKGASFLDVTTFPQIVVEVSGAQLSAGTWVGTGTLTVHGASTPVDISLTGVEQADASVVLKGTARVDRYAVGITAMKGMAGRWMDLSLSATATLA